MQGFKVIFSQNRSNSILLGRLPFVLFVFFCFLGLGHRQMPTWRRSHPLSARGRLFATFRPLSLYHVSHVYKSQRSARNVLNAGVARFFSLFICVCEIFFVILQRKIKTIIIMPEISSFYGIAIYMYMSEHNPPHFHVKYQG